ncbi:hypothetical protein A3B45_00215 [Candidatus Daviesbacteria bacterium RIFCSPLOWO2_01_FULL_39_12]|uniref:Glycosyltransferase 2-like domain-containing protein n=1 Tax=Candidatus Daviesbacteria bacterium RIFCSPLOWO2_01_FULL_39_12 TaxID=1797785 RepID=A0A1F5KNX8_9BACT|nr:MAG: hypothetical protein A3B45_00215 [Candidatus Daviesbacteria bacterium RIFCSPLOWO2_01_FULL_39_12]
MKLSVIIPVFNEEKTVKTLLERVFLAKLPKNIKKKVIVVDDGSNDSSEFRIQSSEFRKKFKFISHQKNLGKGAAIRTGLMHATGDYVIIQDADLEYDPNDYAKLLEPLIKRKAKVVFGTRLRSYPLKIWGKNKTVLPIHLVVNKLLTFFTNILFGSNLTDMETGYKVFDAKLINKIDLKSDGFDFEPEITAKILRMGTSIVEVPINVKPRTYNEGKKIGWKDGLIAIWALIKYRVVR